MFTKGRKDQMLISLPPNHTIRYRRTRDPLHLNTKWQKHTPTNIKLSHHLLLGVGQNSKKNHPANNLEYCIPGSTNPSEAVIFSTARTNVFSKFNTAKSSSPRLQQRHATEHLLRTPTPTPPSLRFSLTGRKTPTYLLTPFFKIPSYQALVL